MTTADLIANVLDVLRRQFYADTPREFLRDENALKRALAIWGHECHHRGWDFDARYIQREILDLLNEIKRSGAVIDYLPVYLAGAIRRRIGLKSERLAADWRRIGNQSARVLKKVEAGVVTAVIEPTDTEILATLHHQLKRARRERKTSRRSVQKELL